MSERSGVDASRDLQDAARQQAPSANAPLTKPPAEPPPAGTGVKDTAAASEPLSSLPRGPIPVQVVVLSLPMLGEQFVNFLVGLVDVFLAGQVSKEATAAVGTAGYLAWFVTLSFSLVGTGAAAVVSRSFGARDLTTANRTLHQAVLLGLGLGAIVAVAAFASAPLLAALLGQTPATTQIMATYIRIDSLGYALYSMVLICGGVLRAAGDTRTPMMVLVFVNIVNAIVSAALVFGWGVPALGVTGIAIGTVTARVLGGLLMLALMLRGIRGLRVRISGLLPERAIIARILRVGVPAAGEAALMWTAQLCFIAIVARTATGEAATVNFAAHMIAVRLTAITYLPAVAWMTAAGTMVGQYLGAKRPADAARSGHVAAAEGAALTTLMAMIYFFFAEPIYRVMSDDPAVIEIGSSALQVAAFFQPALCAAIVYIGALRGAGDTRATMVMSLIGGIMLRVPLAYLGGVVLGGGLLGAWIGMFADNIAKFLMGLGRFAHGGWKRIRV